MQTLKWMLAGLLLLGLGCGGGDKDKDSEKKSESAPNETSAVADANTPGNEAKTGQSPATNVDDRLPPNVIVQKFLESLCKGDKTTTEQLLTETARQRTREHDLTVAPPGAPDAKFEVGGVRTVEGGVNVLSRWTEPDGKGGTVSHNITWVLRKQEEGWRIVGLASELEAGKMTFLNFENPAEMMDTYEQADQLETKTDIRQATRPANEPVR